MSNINFKGFKGYVDKINGYFVWDVRNKNGDRLADLEGGYSPNIFEHKRFIKRQILKFLEDPIGFIYTYHGGHLLKNLSDKTKAKQVSMMLDARNNSKRNKKEIQKKEKTFGGLTNGIKRLEKNKM